MAGNIEGQGIPAPAAVPGIPTTVADLVQDFPELADELSYGGYTAWRDVGQFDAHSSALYKQYPGMRPHPFVW